MFDIDKFFLSRLYINSNGGTDFKENTHEWHANRLINAYLAVLKDSPNSFQDLNGSIDNDTSLLTDVRDDLREGQKTKTLMPYSAYTLRSQSATKNVFIAGKFGIGPFALNNNMHILMQLYGVKFAEGENIMSDLGLTKLGGFTDRYGRSILSWFSGLINAHVDAAKDPWIPELNVNKYTYNLVAVLTHAGFGKDTFYFTTQPIMKQLATAYENASGIYMNDQSKSKTKVQQEAEEEVIKNMIDVHWNKQLLEDGVAIKQTFSFSSYNAAVRAYWKTRKYTPQEAIKALFEKDCQVMRQIAKKHIGEPGSQFLSVEDDQTSYWLTINGQEYNLSAFDVQMIVAAANSEFKPYAEALSKLVQHTKIDTKKQGKNLIEQRKYLQGVSDLFDSTQMAEDRSLFDTETLDRLYKDSYIQHQTKLATDLFRNIMANQMIEATDKFVTDVDRVLKTIGNPGTDPKVLNAVQKGIMAKIKSKFFFGPGGYCERHKIDPRSLVAGKNTIYDRRLAIKAMLMNDPKYKDLLDRRSGEPSNYLLRALVSGNKYRRFDEEVSYSIGTSPDTFMDAKFVQTLGFVTDESFNADDLSQAWDDLLQDSKYPELQQFARELVVYSFITSGDNGGNYDLFKYVPNTWRLGQTEEGASYADYMAQQHAKYVDGVDVLDENDFEDVILNMWQDDNIVPKYSIYRKNFKLFESWDTDKSAAGLPVVMGAVDKKGQPTIRRDKAYIKVPRFNNGAEVKGQRGYVVYKRIGYGTSKANQLYPIYAMIDPRGEVFDKNEKILQYWQEDYSETRNIVEKYLGQILKAAELQAATVEEAVTKIADYILANKLDLQKIVEGGLLDENLSYIIKDINRTSSTVAQNDQPLPVQTVNFYEGMIVPDGNTIFVFGSNPGGVHGAGAAKTARDMFGAQKGVGEGMTGNAYALPTKDLEASKGTEWYKPGEEQRDKILQYYKQQQSGVTFDPSNISYQEVVDNPIKRTITPDKIVESIKHMYETARQNPDKQFKVAYTNGLSEITYNGYVGAEMIEMFKEAGPIPSNVLFSRAWVSSGMFDQTITQPETKAPGTYDMPQQNQQKVYTENGKPVIMYRGYALAENREATSIEETIAHTAVDYDESLKGAIYFTSSAEEAQDYANTRTDKSDETFVNDTGETITQRNRHYTGDYAKVSRYALKPTAKVEHYKNMSDYVQKGANSIADVIILDEGTMWKDNTEYVVKNPSVLIQIPQEERKPRLIKKGKTDYEDVYMNMTDSEYEEWKNNQEIEQVLGGGEEAKEEIKDAIKVAKRGISFEEALSKELPFFDSSEQQQIKQALNGRNLQVMSVSRYTDPAFFSEKIIKFLEENYKKPLTDPTRVNAIELWTKHDGLPIRNILEACKKYRVAPMVSFSVTGLGGTSLEKGVMKYQDLLERIGQLIQLGIVNPTTTTIRIDPILVGMTSMDDIKTIVTTAKSFGIKKFVTSLVQSYGYTEGTPNDRKVVSGINEALQSDGKSYDWDKYYGRITYGRNAGKINFKPKQEYIDQVGKVLVELDKDPEITIQTCSFGIPGLKVSACLDPLIIERVTGVDVTAKDGSYQRDTSRPECMCYGCHGDFFKWNQTKCFSSCAYCYAAHSSDNKLNYYNEDGTLKDNPYTRTEKQETHKMQAIDRNPYKIQLESKQIVLSTDVSDAFYKYLQKSRNNYPKEFYDNEKRVKYVKSNNHKHSRLYDIVDIETGEIIAQKLPLFTKDQWERQQESRKKLDEQFTNYNQQRSFAFKKSISTPSKGLFKKMAKQYLLEAIRAQSDVSESVINHKIIDDFVDQFNDTVWEHIITYALDPTHGPGREDSAYDARLFGMATTDPRELLRFAFNPTIPKQGLIDEVCKALNLDKNTLTFTGYVKGEYYKKQKVNRNLPYDVLQEMLEQIAEDEDKRVEMELIRAYAESTGETVQQVQDRINRLRQEGTIEASKEIQRILHGTSATNIVLRTQENYSKQYRQWLDKKGIVVPNNIVRIIFNRHSFAADDTPIVRLATIMHEPFHALEMLHHGTEALDKVQHAFDAFLQTEYGKQIFEDYKKHNSEITGYKEGDLPSEFLADLFSLMMMPPQLRAQYTAAEDRILGARLAKTLNDLLNSPDFKTIMTVEPKAVIESFTERQRIILPLLKQIYNAIIKWLSEYSTFVKNTFKLYDEFVTVTSYRRNDTFEKVEQVNKLGVSFEEALNTLSEAMARLSLEDVAAGQSVPASTMFMQSNQYSDYIESQAYLDNLKSLGEEQERKCKGE